MLGTLAISRLECPGARCHTERWLRIGRPGSSGGPDGWCSGDAMKAADVDALVRDVIIHMRAPFALLSVAGSPAGWNIQVRAGTGGIVRFTVAERRPLAMRVAIQENLELEY